MLGPIVIKLKDAMILNKLLATLTHLLEMDIGHLVESRYQTVLFECCVLLILDYVILGNHENSSRPLLPTEKVCNGAFWNLQLILLNL